MGRVRVLRVAFSLLLGTAFAPAVHPDRLTQSGQTLIGDKNYFLKGVKPVQDNASSNRYSGRTITGTSTRGCARCG